MQTFIEARVSTPQEQVDTVFDALSPNQLPSDGLQLAARNGVALRAGPGRREIVVDTKDSDVLGDSAHLRWGSPDGPALDVFENNQRVELHPFTAVALASFVTEQAVGTFARENHVSVASTYPISGGSNNVFE